MMKTTYLKTDGSAVPEGHCVNPDHTVDTIRIDVRSLQGVGTDLLHALREFIQKKHEVTRCQVTERTVYVK
jgi:hypothetical protein